MKILQRIKDGAGKVTDRAQNVVEIGRMNTQISNIEREMGLYYQKMGEIFYEGYRSKDMSLAEKEMMELAKTCDLLTEERDELRNKIAGLKNERICASCGKSVTEQAAFCQYCGQKLVTVSKYTTPSQPPAAEPEPVTKPVIEIGKNFGKDPGPVVKEPVNDQDLLKKLLNNDMRVKERPVREEPPRPLDPEEEARRLRHLEEERKRQEELDRRIRTWKENSQLKEEISTGLETELNIATVNCQICSTPLVKGTKWCPHCGSEQI